MAAAVEHNDAAKARQLGAGLINLSDLALRRSAQLALARLSIDAGKPADAGRALSQVHEQLEGRQLRRIARLRLARVLIDRASRTMPSTLAEDSRAPLPRSSRRPRDAFYAKKDMKDAAAEYTAAPRAPRWAA